MKAISGVMCSCSQYEISLFSEREQIIASPAVLWSGDLQSYSVILNEGREGGNSWNISEFKYQNIFYGNYFRIKIRFNIISFEAHRSEVVWFIFWTTWQSNHARLLKWFDCIDMIMSVLTALQSVLGDKRVFIIETFYHFDNYRALAMGNPPWAT